MKRSVGTELALPAAPLRCILPGGAVHWRNGPAWPGALTGPLACCGSVPFLAAMSGGKAFESGCPQAWLVFCCSRVRKQEPVSDWEALRCFPTGLPSTRWSGSVSTHNKWHNELRFQSFIGSNRSNSCKKSK